MNGAPTVRVRVVNDGPVRPEGDYVLYWMTASRRTRYNFALDHALEQARRVGRPLLVLEGLRVDHPWAAERHHRFVVDGMLDQARAFAAAGVRYHPWVEPEPGASRGLLHALAARAALVVGDDTPAFFHPRMVRAAARGLPVRYEVVDGVGLLPVAGAGGPWHRAVDFRRQLQRLLPGQLGALPSPAPLAGYDLGLATVPAGVSARWPATDLDGVDLSRLPVDHAVGPVAERGGQEAGSRALGEFLERLPRYGEGRSDPDASAQSGLSAWLHHGHLGAHEVFATVARAEGWTGERLGGVTGRRDGWWGMSASAEAFLDELVTWRELCHHTAAVVPGYDRFETLPGWARATLEAHRGDPRPDRYSRAQLEDAATHDRVWNAAQRQLREEGRIHNYLRMLWGKKVLEWTADPAAAFETLVELNNRWAIDGRDPNSIGGIAWVFGRYDRPWAPARPGLGVVRYMSSDRAVQKLSMDRWLERWSPPSPAPRSPDAPAARRAPGAA